MAIILSDNINYKAPKLADARMSYNGERPYVDIQEALDTVTKPNRSPGLSAFITENGQTVEYWYKNGVEDSDLVLKSIGGGAGTSGTSGTSGVNGQDGTSGTSGVNGQDGTSGTSGVNGQDGTSGTSGVNGQDGTSGTSGVNGQDGTSGTSGVNGQDGTSGTSGVNGQDGTSGTSGSSGVDGAIGPIGPTGPSGNLGDVYEEDVGLTMDHPTVGTVIGEDQQIFNSKVDGILEALIGNVDPPEYDEPTTNISLSNMTLEIGSSNVRTITNSFVQNDAGALVSQRIYKNSIEVSDTGSYNETGIVATGSTVYRGQVTYAEGPTKNNAIGIPDPRNKIVAGTISTSNRTITGILPYYWKEFDVIPDLDNLDMSDFNKVVASSNGTITLTMNIETKHLVILTPSGSTTKTKWEVTPLNAGDIGTGELILNPVIKTISSEHSYWINEAYKVYTTAYVTSVSPKISLIN